MGYGQVTIGSGTSQLILSANTQRISIIISNEGSSTFRIGGDSSLTTATGIAITEGGNFTEDSGERGMYLGDIYGIAYSGTALAGFWERVR